MNDEILKLAKECGFSDKQWEAMFRDVGPYEVTEPRLAMTAFYKATYNRAIEDASSILRHECECGCPCDCYSHATARFQIRTLEKK